MKVKELIEALKEIPQEENVIMFDGTASYTPSKVYVCQWANSEAINGVIID